MGDIQPDLTYRLRNWATTPALCAEAADEIERLRDDLARVNDYDQQRFDVLTDRAERAEADADRLAETIEEHGDYGLALDLHDKEVEAR